MKGILNECDRKATNITRHRIGSRVLQRGKIYFDDMNRDIYTRDFLGKEKILMTSRLRFFKFLKTILYKTTDNHHKEEI